MHVALFLLHLTVSCFILSWLNESAAVESLVVRSLVKAGIFFQGTETSLAWISPFLRVIFVAMKNQYSRFSRER